MRTNCVLARISLSYGVGSQGKDDRTAPKIHHQCAHWVFKLL